MVLSSTGHFELTVEFTGDVGKVLDADVDGLSCSVIRDSDDGGGVREHIVFNVFIIVDEIELSFKVNKACLGSVSYN